MSSGLLEPPEGGEPLCVFLLRDRGDEEEEEEEEEETSRDVGCQWESPEEDRREVGCQSDSAERRDAAVQVDLLTQQLSWRHTELPRHSLILDVRTRWNSLYLTLERFTEQYPVIQAASLDQRLRKNMERDRLARLTEEDFRRAEDFINLMKVLYASTLCVSSEKSPTCGQILPILQKLEAHLTVKEGDTVFVSNLKKQNDEIRSFLQVATALDPRFKHKLDDDTVWDQIQRKLIEQSTEEDCGADGDTMQSEKRPENEAEENEDEEESQPPPCKLSRKTPLEELFAEEEAQNIVSQQSSMSIKKRVERELQIYQEVPPAIMSEDPAAWWWNQRKTYPLLSDLAFSYLCIQASSTPSERVLHCRRHYLSRTVTHTA